MSILIGEERTELSRIGDKNSGDGNISVAFLWPAGISRIILNIVYDEKEIYRFTLNKMLEKVKINVDFWNVIMYTKLGFIYNELV